MSLISAWRRVITLILWRQWRDTLSEAPGLRDTYGHEAILPHPHQTKALYNRLATSARAITLHAARNHVAPHRSSLFHHREHGGTGDDISNDFALENVAGGHFTSIHAVYAAVAAGFYRRRERHRASEAFTKWRERWRNRSTSRAHSRHQPILTSFRAKLSHQQQYRIEPSRPVCAPTTF